ncbi:hypothetical protein [Streptomyces sp. NPDC051909]|uniref:hypothetical protein n=1 Tax=Streptomyces sp. NPDC051909 TaxID=3154944 RepID=UPI003431C9DD
MKRITFPIIVMIMLGVAGCRDGNGPQGDASASPLGGKVPSELVGTWGSGAIDLTLWENYREGYYAGRNAIPTREVMIFKEDGAAKFYRYEYALNLYEELIDCEGFVTFNEDGTFTFHPVKGRKRFYDSNPGNVADKALSGGELNDPEISGKRSYIYHGETNPATLEITVPGSAPYSWYKSE